MENGEKGSEEESNKPNNRQQDQKLTEKQTNAKGHRANDLNSNGSEEYSPHKPNNKNRHLGDVFVFSFYHMITMFFNSEPRQKVF